ncbi:MAG TPA: ABC transporter ATP-binding protein [bacterium (Candidatus Stahlbacteria)]|nr:ABC transporter ATP-binding protein [Candidatus Stahlbacteria bacterium]
MIYVKNLTFSYFDHPVINDISFSIEKGDFVGIIGPNGAGKSTLLRLLANILKGQSGSIQIDGRDLDSFRREDLARLVGFIPQETHFSLNFRVFDVILQGRYPHLGFFKIEDLNDNRIVDEAIQRTRISHLSDKQILDISSGERQMVVITRAVAQRPEILLLDEPTSFLDIKHQVEIMNLLKDLNREGITIIVVVHDLNLAGLFCGRLLLINQGRIAASGSPAEIITPEMIKKIYGVDVVGVNHPTAGLPQILLG